MKVHPGARLDHTHIIERIVIGFWFACFHLFAQLQDMLQPSDGKSGLPTAHPLKVMRGAQWVAPTIVGFAAVPKHEETKCALVLITDRGHRCVLSLVQC